jgi:hypothetical protein
VSVCGYISQFSVIVVRQLFDFDAMRSDTQIFLEVVNVHVKYLLELIWGGWGEGVLGWTFLKNDSWWIHYWEL